MRALACAAVLFTLPTAPRAQQPAPPTPGGNAATELSKATQNPVGDLISIPAQFNFYSGGGLRAQTLSNLNVQPVLPFHIGKHYTLIARTIVPFYNVPIVDVDPIPDGLLRVRGVGDIQEQLFVTPATPGPVIWGLGPILSFPTATNRLVETGAWGVGPTAVVLRNTGPWVFGALVSQLWTLAQNDDSLNGPDLNVFALQPFINYNIADGWAIVTAPIVSANWSADDDDDRWTIPVGLGVSKVAAIGRQPVSLAIQYYYNVRRPRLTGNNQLRLVASLLFPKT